MKNSKTEDRKTIISGHALVLWRLVSFVFFKKMGAFKSKEDNDDEKFVLDPSLIFWDDFGNLTYGEFCRSYQLTNHSVLQERHILSNKKSK